MNKIEKIRSECFKFPISFPQMPFLISPPVMVMLDLLHLNSEYIKKKSYCLIKIISKLFISKYVCRVGVVDTD